MTSAEVLDTTRLHRVAGRTGQHTAVVTARPYRTPLQPVADVRLIGGRHISRPGEVSWTHHGVFLPDALPACTRYGLDALQEPRERGRRDAHTHNRPTLGGRPAGAARVQTTRGSGLALGGYRCRARTPARGDETCAQEP
jgi:hypothetical protein